jgi:hypothetical protein
LGRSITERPTEGDAMRTNADAATPPRKNSKRRESLAKAKIARKGLPAAKTTPLKRSNGKNRRTAVQLERQEKAFLLNVIECRTIRQVAIDLGVSQETVISDIRHEMELRAKENESRREHDTAVSIARYQGVITKAEKKSELYDGIAGAGGKVVDHSLDAILKAQERIDKLLGLEAPSRIDLGLSTLLEAIDPK